MTNVNGFPPSPWERVGVRLLFLLLLGLLCGCERRDLTYDSQEGVPFRIALDWSNLTPGIDKPQYIKALFFPIEGGQAIERFISSEGDQVNVPVGEYRVIIYNWRTNTATQTVQFRGDTYDSFEAYVAPRNVTMTTRGGQTLSLLPRPDIQLYGWNTGGETVIVSATSPAVRTRSSEGDILTAVMHSIVRSYVVAVHVANDQYLGGMSALAIDAYGSAPLGGGSPKSERYALETKVERGKEVAGGTRIYYCRVTTFGLFDDSPKNLVLDVTNTEGEARRVEVDITEAVGKIDMGGTSTADPPVVVPPGDPVVVPPVDSSNQGGIGGGFSPPALDDWDEESKDIFI